MGGSGSITFFSVSNGLKKKNIVNWVIALQKEQISEREGLMNIKY